MMQTFATRGFRLLRGRGVPLSVSHFSSAAVTSQLVKELREKSGAPMMDCKKALSDPSVGGDIEKAISWLRKKGISKATQSDCTSQEGLVAILSSSDNITLVEVNSETDFVGKNDKFHSFVAMVADTCRNQMSAAKEVDVEELMGKHVSTTTKQTLRESLGDIISQIRENIVVRRALNLSSSKPGSSIFAGYVHGRVGAEHLPENVSMGKMAAVVELTVDSIDPVHKNSIQEAAKRLAMHVVAAKPQYLSADLVPKSLIDTEVAVFRDQTLSQAATPDKSGKVKKAPTGEMLDKIINGKVQKRLAEICLLSQPHVAEEGSPVVSKYFDALGKKLGTNIKVERFLSWSVGQTEQKK